MLKTEWIQAYFTDVGKWEDYEKPTGETKKGLFGEKPVTSKEKRFVKTGVSDCWIDGKRLAKDMEEAMKKLEKEGYEILQITEVLSGNYNWKGYSNPPGPGAATAVSWGFSYLEEVIITAKK